MNQNVIESALLFSNIYEETGENIIDSENINEDELKNIIISYLKQICYTGKKKGNNPGLLEKMEYNKKIVGRYNKSFKSKENGRQFFANVESTDYENPFKLTDLSNEFSDDNLESLSLEELMARAMHWSNKLAKAFEEKINESKKDSPKYDTFEKKVYPKLLSENLEEFYEMYIYCEGMTDEEIMEDIGKSQFEKFAKSRKIVQDALRTTKIKIKEEDVSNYIHFSTLLSARSNAYALKSKFMQRCIFQVLKKQKEDVLQYVTVDNAKTEDDSYKYIYGIAIEGHIEPFEVHANSSDIEGSIQIANELLNKECGIDVIYDVQRFKTEVPRKITEDERRKMERVEALGGEVGKFAGQVNNLTNFILKNSIKTNERYTAVGLVDARKIGDER
ncbi:MAG: hypothetical protein IJ809_01290 [Clostridia bacterium]|nr:hypothetical protein [Clostridia bacterium]